jgi:hypothetical protein
MRAAGAEEDVQEARYTYLVEQRAWAIRLPAWSIASAMSCERLPTQALDAFYPGWVNILSRASAREQGKFRYDIAPLFFNDGY